MIFHLRFLFVYSKTFLLSLNLKYKRLSSFDVQVFSFSQKTSTTKSKSTGLLEEPGIRASFSLKMHSTPKSKRSTYFLHLLSLTWFTLVHPVYEFVTDFLFSFFRSLVPHPPRRSIHDSEGPPDLGYQYWNVCGVVWCRALGKFIILNLCTLFTLITPLQGAHLYKERCQYYRTRESQDDQSHQCPQGPQGPAGVAGAAGGPPAQAPQPRNILRRLWLAIRT